MSVSKMIVHRLDHHTSGLVILARTPEVQKKLHAMFRDKTIKKRYEALIVGNKQLEVEGVVDLPIVKCWERRPTVRIDDVEARKSISDEIERRIVMIDGKEGEFEDPLFLKGLTFLQTFQKRAPKESVTKYKVIEDNVKLPGFETTDRVRRVELTPVTGRTHQLRVHMQSLGCPILGDHFYEWNGRSLYSERMEEKGEGLSELWESEGKSLCLHAKELKMDHPVTGETLTFVDEVPFN